MSENDLDETIPNDLWQVPLYIPELRPKLTDETIASFEKKLGRKLPVAFIEALRIQNGGYFHRTEHPTGFSFDFLPGIVVGDPSISALSARRVQFGGDGHYYYVLDYLNSDTEPSVVLHDIEQQVDTILAPDFATFLHELTPPTETRVFGLATFDDVSDVVQRVQKAMDIELKDRDRPDGYALFTYRFSHRTNASLCLEANGCKRGYQPAARGQIKSSRMNDDVLRYPGLSEYGYFLVCDCPYDDHPDYMGFEFLVEESGLNGAWVYRHGEPEPEPKSDLSFDELAELVNFFSDENHAEKSGSGVDDPHT